MASTMLRDTTALSTRSLTIIGRSGLMVSVACRSPLRSPINLLLLTVPESNLHHGNGVRIVLLFTFERQQVVVRTPFCDRKLTADRGPRVIDPAAPRFGIDELASLTKQVIALPA